jgi:predicted nucleic-acid-binding protein
MKTWDSNFLLRHLLEDDAGQLAVVRSELAEAEAAAVAVFLPQIVLVEVAWYLRGLMVRQDVLDTLQELLNDSRFACEQASAVENALRKARIKGDFSDHLIAAAARAADAMPVQTFDQALRNFPEFEIHRKRVGR